MRLFIGFPLSESAREDTAALAVRAKDVIPGRYVITSNYHMTLAFLGEVLPDQLPAAKQALDAFAAHFYAPELTLGGLSFFGRASNAIFIRTIKSTEDLYAMHDALLNELRARSLPFSQGPFSPHVTLARHADVSCVSLEALPSSSYFFAVPHAVLYLSARDEQNTLRYTPLHSSSFRSFP